MRIRSTRDLAAAVRGRRRDLGMSQADLAQRAGVSRKWIYEFEAGKPAAEMGFVLRVLETLGLSLDVGEGPRRRTSQKRFDLDAILDEHRTR
jgi:HTH-type transcriptional regulator/antitoxin HipB